MVGGELTVQLARAGWSNICLPVRYLTRLNRLLERFDKEGLDTGVLHATEAALNNQADMVELLQGAKLLFHCAAQVSFGDGDGNIVTNNVEITSTLVDAALACGVEKMVHISSIAALGGVREGGFVTESTRMESLRGQSPYSVSKFLSEQQVQRGATQGLKCVIVNPAVILGAGDWHGGGSAAIVRFVASGLPFYPPGTTGYVDVQDVARAMIVLAESDEASGKSFILCGASIPFRELITLAATAAGKRKPFIKAGRTMLYIFWWCERLLSLFGYRPNLSRLAIHSGVTICRYDGGRITRLTGFRYTPVAETVERVVKCWLNDKNSRRNSCRG